MIIINYLHMPSYFRGHLLNAPNRLLVFYFIDVIDVRLIWSLQSRGFQLRHA